MFMEDGGLEPGRGYIVEFCLKRSEAFEMWRGKGYAMVKVL